MAIKGGKRGPNKVKKADTEFVTLERFERLESGVNKMLDLMEKQAEASVSVLSGEVIPSASTGVAPVIVPETPVEKSIRKAGPNEIPMNPEWEEMAQDIIGEAVDHCEIAYLKNGGVLFTVIIRDEFSNAGHDYLQRMGSDRRSKEVGTEGIAGVEEWCRLIKSNLAKSK